MRSRKPAVQFILLLLPIVLLRVIYLQSDAYARLSWSSALLTDEGFYTHNARNLILFGQERTDDFNNALLMPLLHLAQVLVFRWFGVGALQARSLSVAISLLTLLLFFAALRRAFGSRVGWLGVMLLGLDPVFVLYNRLALMDTPACLPLIAAFYGWVRSGETQPSKSGLERGSWLFFSACCLVSAYAVRGLTAFVAAVPLLILLVQACISIHEWKHEWKADKADKANKTDKERTERRKIGPILMPLAAFSTGLLASYGLYLVLWYFPHRSELAFLNNYYIQEQLLPHSWKHMQANIRDAFVHPYRGVFPYLCKHSPFLLFLSAAAVGFNLFDRRTNRKMRSPLSSRCRQNFWGQDFLIGWVIIYLLFVSVVDYSPSRYYILFYPALAGLAALGLDRLAHSGISLGSLITHFTKRYLPSLGVAQRFPTTYRLNSPQILGGVLSLWMGLNLYWYVDWLSHLTYRQRDADAWLATHLPQDSVLFGAVAPGLCLNNHLRCVTMLPHLCNDNHPIERFAPSPRFIVMLDQDAAYSEKSEKRAEHKLTKRTKISMLAKHTASQELAWANRWREHWWEIHYPGIVQPKRRLHAFPQLIRPFFTVGIYAVPYDYDYINYFYEKYVCLRKDF